MGKTKASGSDDEDEDEEDDADDSEGGAEGGEGGRGGGVQDLLSEHIINGNPQGLALLAGQE